MYPHVTQSEARLRRLNEEIELLEAPREPGERRRDARTLPRGRRLWARRAALPGGLLHRAGD
jgi:hypothetical protein